MRPATGGGRGGFLGHSGGPCILIGLAGVFLCVSGKSTVSTSYRTVSAFCNLRNRFVDNPSRHASLQRHCSIEFDSFCWYQMPHRPHVDHIKSKKQKCVQIFYEC